jgi:hypothetical protein
VDDPRVCVPQVVPRGNRVDALVPNVSPRSVHDRQAEWVKEPRDMPCPGRGCCTY